MKVDIHTHILPSKLPDLKSRYGCAGWINIRPNEQDPNCADMYKDDKFFRRIEKNCWCLSERCCDMGKTNVSAQVLSTVPVMFNYWAKPEHTLDLCHLLNDDMAFQIRENQQNQARLYDLNNSHREQKFFAFGTLPMQKPELAIEEMSRCVNDLGFQGFQIGSHINEWNLDEKKLYPIWKRAEDLNCAIFVHPWDMEHVSRTSKYWLPWLVGMPAETCTAICSILMGNVLAQFPRLKICFAHGGGSFPFTIGRIQHGYDMRPDLCATECSIGPKEFLGKFYTDSLVHSQESLKLLVKVIGEDRIMLGTDYPFPLGELSPGSLIQSSDFNQSIKDKLLYKNAMNFLGVQTP